VSKRGVEKAEKIGSDRYGYYQDLAIIDDARGILHLAIKDEYWFLDKGVWRLVGVNTCRLMTRVGDLVGRATEAGGKELGTAGQWGMQAFGGFGAGIIITYRNQGARLS
jgi:hypothetical protein